MSNNQMTLGQKLKSYKRTPFSFLMMLLVGECETFSVK